MLKLSWKQINNNELAEAVFSLANNKNLEATTSYRVGRIWDYFKSAMDKLQAEERKLWSKYCILDEKGNVKLDPSPDQRRMVPTFASVEKEAEFDKEFEGIQEANFVELKIHRLDFTKLNGLNGRNYAALGNAGFLENVPKEEEAA